MNLTRSLLTIFLVVFLLVSAPAPSMAAPVSAVASTGAAQIGGPNGPGVPELPTGPIHSGGSGDPRIVQDVDGRWTHLPELPVESAPAENSAAGSTALSGGINSDPFGYTSTASTYSWIDATRGTRLPVVNYWDNYVSLPFEFPFYENTYSELWVNENGLIAFHPWTSNYAFSANGLEFPTSEEGAQIVPLFSHFRSLSQEPRSHIYTKSGESAGIQYFAIEWYQMVYAYPPYPGETIFTFEVVLYENGNIKYQYQDLNAYAGFYCDSVAIGMQDEHGANGLDFLDKCQIPDDRSAVLIVPPAPTYRALLLEPYQGVFAGANQEIDFTFRLVNNGTLGSDEYELYGGGSGSVNFYTGSELLTDTNGDGRANIGPLEQGEEIEIIACLHTPLFVNVYDLYYADVEARSASDLARTAPGRFEVTVPPSFAQVNFDNQRERVSDALVLYSPGGARGFPVPYYPAHNDAWNAEFATAELADHSGYIVVWNEQRYSRNYDYSVRNIYYSIVSRDGKILAGPTALTSSTLDPTVDVYNEHPSVAVAPDGAIGVAWERWSVRESDNYRLHNIYFAILDPDGKLAAAAQNITGESRWRDSSGENFIWYGANTLAATGDNRFFLAYEKDGPVDSSSGQKYLSDIYYTVRSTDGTVLKAPARFTSDSASDEAGYGTPYAHPVNGSQVLLAMVRFPEESSPEVLYSVTDSLGNTLSPITSAGDNAGIDGTPGPIAEQLADGSIALAWQNSGGIHVAMFNSDMSQSRGSVDLDHPALKLSSFWSNWFNLSMFSDLQGNLALTWNDGDMNRSKNLYFAAVDSQANIITAPSIYHTSPWQVLSGQSGKADAGSTLPLPEGQPDLYITLPEKGEKRSGELFTIPVEVGNLGDQTVGEVTIEVTLHSGLIYAGNTAGRDPVISEGSGGPSFNGGPMGPGLGTTYTWTFPAANLKTGGAGHFAVYVTTGSDQAGETYTASASVHMPAGEMEAFNNTTAITITNVASYFGPYIQH